ncbi:acyltransferase family protein [Lentisalinibacter orientalis]|uniref:acyltransferase family protein n=1 Tax=Lentisalinibacter orientalis TaxID=2992241 RepID=UPI00386FBAF3
MSRSSLPTPKHGERSARIAGIDVLRGFAALAVVFSHYLNWWDRYVADIPLIAPGEYGYYAVQLFFVISGIVIFNTLNKCKSSFHFLYLRFTRLYPTYWAALFGVTLITVFAFGNDVWLTGVAVNATMLQEFLGYEHFDNVYWSLTVELTFYAHVAWLFSLGWHRRVHLICGCWLIVSCIWAIAVGKGESRDVFALTLALDQAAFFAIGIMLYEIRRNGMRVASAIMLALALLTALLVEGVTGLLVATSVLALAALGLWGYLKPLANSATLFLGGISFALYLVHRNLGYLALERFSGAGLGPLPSIVLVVIGALALAALVTYAVERPSIRLLRRLRFT